MFSGSYNKIALIRRPSLWSETEASTTKSGSSKLRKLKTLQEDDKFFGNTGVTGTVKPEKKEADPQIFIRQVHDLNNSKYQEYGNALRPITSRIFATRPHNEKHCSEGSLLKLLNIDSEKGKTYKIVETAINDTNKELWLYCDRVQNNIEE
nr:MAG TPA: hypothetical protein [Caudoviricetes sp.]